jgi:hypothetical protein
MEDGTTISLADTSANYLRWKLSLQDLADQEAISFTNFFAATQGQLQPFLFLDPTANLLVWSQDFTQSAWVSPGITFDSAVADPFGGTGAVRAHNQTTATLSVLQQTQIPASIQTCFSLYMRSDTPLQTALAQSVDSQSQTVSAGVTTVWQRFYVSGVFTGVTDSLRYVIQVPAGTSIELFGPQVDAQVTPSRYIATAGSSGVYPNARFDADHIDRIATGPNRNTCVMFIRCNLPGGE